MVRYLYYLHDVIARFWFNRLYITIWWSCSEALSRIIKPNLPISTLGGGGDPRRKRKFLSCTNPIMPTSYLWQDRSHDNILFDRFCQKKIKLSFNLISKFILQGRMKSNHSFDKFFLSFTCGQVYLWSWFMFLSFSTKGLRVKKFVFHAHKSQNSHQFCSCPQVSFTKCSSFSFSNQLI